MFPGMHVCRLRSHTISTHIIVLHQHTLVHVLLLLQALEMFTSMRMFDEAKQWAEKAARSGGVGKGSAGPGGAGGAAAVAELIGRQAEWSEETANYEAAVEMYIKVGGHGWLCDARAGC